MYYRARGNNEDIHAMVTEEKSIEYTTVKGTQLTSILIYRPGVREHKNVGDDAIFIVSACTHKIIIVQHLLYKKCYYIRLK